MILLLPLASFLVALLGTGLVLRLLRRRAILDHPNERSSHRQPTPRGAGLAVIPVLALSWLAAGPADELWLGVLAGVALAALGWADDLLHLPALVRLLGQAVAVAVALVALPFDGPVFQGLLPPGLDRLAAGLLWLWFINLFNFMDGIDGISGVEAIAIGAGLALVLWAGGHDPAFALYGLTLAAAAAGFLVWNWAPAKIFLGDVGSVALGFFLGWLLLGLAAKGFWAAALLLPLYYLADASLTLLRRLARGERVWQAHRQHFYQQAADRFASHAAVSLRLGLLNLGLIGLSLGATAAPALAWPAVISGLVLVALLLWYFAGTTGKALHVD